MSHTKQVDYIYNPLNQTPEELRRSFVVREKEFNTIFNDIKTSKMKHPEPHYVVQGKRGQGKTTLLLKLYYEIKEDKTLSKFIVPVIFNEEQYHINSLFGLWSHTAEKLEEENELFLGLYDAVEDAYDHGNSELDAFKCLESTLKKEKKKLVLFVDNVGQLFKKLNKREQQRLREVFIACPEIRIFGASAEILEHTYDYSKPFYELFRFINLEGLTQNEAEALLLKLGEHYKQDNIKKIIQKEPGRIEALRRLTGGVPRTIVLLFEIFVDHKDGDSFLDLEVVLDRVTPLYKHRMDDLPVQQQKIVDAIALHWDAMAVKQIASKTRMESKAVSSQLKLLEKKRIVHKITTTTKNHFYQVSERFFNIWYLMRYGRRRGKNRVQWLVRFLECWCSGSELEDRTQQHIDALKKGTLHTKHALYFTEALARTKIPDQLQHKLISHARGFLNVKDKTLIEELTKSDIEILQEANILYCKNEFKKALQVLESVQNKSSRVMSFKVYLLYKMGAKDFEEVEDYYLQEIRNEDASAMNNLAIMYEIEAKDFQKAEQYYLMAVKKGNIESMNTLAYINFHEHINKTKTLALLREVVKNDKKDNMVHLHNLSITLLWNDEIAESLKIVTELLNDENYIEELNDVIKEYFILLLSKKQYYAALKLFNENVFDLKERLKPVYYAMMHFLKDDYPNEYKKMGEELKQTVEEIIQMVHQWEKDYA